MWLHGPHAPRDGTDVGPHARCRAVAMHALYRKQWYFGSFVAWFSGLGPRPMVFYDRDLNGTIVEGKYLVWLD